MQQASHRRNFKKGKLHGILTSKEVAPYKYGKPPKFLVGEYMKPVLLIPLLIVFVLGCNSKEEAPVPQTEDKPFASRQVSQLKQEAPAPSNIETDSPVLGENEILVGDFIWEKSSQSGLLSWAAAKSYCNQRTMRMPSLSEIKNNWRKLNGKDAVWTRTEAESEAEAYWILDLSSGTTETTSQDFLNEVRCLKTK